MVTPGHKQLPRGGVAKVGSLGYLSGNTTSERTETATAYTAERLALIVIMLSQTETIMKKDQIHRQIDVFDKKTERLVNEIKIISFDLESMKARFNVPQEDYLMYNPYEIDSSKIDLFADIVFDFNKYDYFLACYGE